MTKNKRFKYPLYYYTITQGQNKMNTQNKIPKIYSVRCDYCRKEFNALNRNQVLSQLSIHQGFCEAKKKVQQLKEKKDENTKI